jgi:hypothetical protein
MMNVALETTVTRTLLAQITWVVLTALAMKDLLEMAHIVQVRMIWDNFYVFFNPLSFGVPTKEPLNYVGKLNIHTSEQFETHYNVTCFFPSAVEAFILPSKHLNVGVSVIAVTK